MCFRGTAIISPNLFLTIKILKFKKGEMLLITDGDFSFVARETF